MPNAQLQYSLSAVKRAGKVFRKGFTSPVELREAIAVIQNWRDCHTVPMAYFYDSLSSIAKTWRPVINVVQRPKRMESMIAKLAKNPTMSLTTMQDVA